MSLNRWKMFTTQQQYGNISSELSRVLQLIELNKLDNAKLALARVIDMLGLQRMLNCKRETAIISETLASNLLEIDSGSLKFALQYFESLAN
jgi:hypothetical protein